MSSRALRKLQNQKEIEAEKERAKAQEVKKDDENEEADEGETEEEDVHNMGAGGKHGARAKMPPHRNPFDLVSGIVISNEIK